MGSAATLTASRTADGYLVRVEGRGTMRESPALREFASRCAADEPRFLLALDLTGCEYLDSTFLGCIVGLNHRGRRDQTLDLTVCAPVETRQRLFGATRLDLVLHCVDQRPEPLSDPVPLLAPDLNSREFGQHIMECHHRLADTGCRGADAFRSVADGLGRELGKA